MSNAGRHWTSLRCAIDYLTQACVKQKMSFSDEYITKLSKATGIAPDLIRRVEPDLLKEIREVLDIAQELEPSGKITKKTLALVLKERSAQFV